MFGSTLDTLFLRAQRLSFTLHQPVVWVRNSAAQPKLSHPPHGTVQAPGLIRTLQTNNRPTGLARALEKWAARCQANRDLPPVAGRPRAGTVARAHGGDACCRPADLITATLRRPPAVARPSYQACAVFQRPCVGCSHPSHVMCVETGHLVRDLARAPPRPTKGLRPLETRFLSIEIPKAQLLTESIDRASGFACLAGYPQGRLLSVLRHTPPGCVNAPVMRGAAGLPPGGPRFQDTGQGLALPTPRNREPHAAKRSCRHAVVRGQPPPTRRVQAGAPRS